MAADEVTRYRNPVVIVSPYGLQAVGRAPLLLPPTLGRRLMSALQSYANIGRKRILRVRKQLALLLEEYKEDLHRYGVFAYLLATCSVYLTQFVFVEDPGGGSSLPCTHKSPAGWRGFLLVTYFIFQLFYRCHNQPKPWRRGGQSLH